MFKLLSLIISFSLLFSQNYSLHLDGSDDFVDIGNGENIYNINNEVSFSAWIKPTQTLEQTIFDGSSSVSSTDERNSGIKVALNSENKIYGFVGLGVHKDYTKIISNTVLNLNEWYYIAFVRNQNVMQLYINGELDAEKNDVPNLNISYDGADYEADKYLLGAYTRKNPPNDYESFYAFYQGNITKVQLYNSAISQEDIQLNMYGETVETNLVASWRFNEGAGVLLSDSSPLNMNGVIIGPDWSSEYPLYGCTDELACNYDENANFVDGTCIFPEENYDCDGNQIVTDIDGNIYLTVQIGEQLWMGENLNVTHYSNGDPITHITNNGDWGSLSTGVFGEYNNNIEISEIYGKLYNWYVANDERNVCPDGWHVPSDDEFKILEMALGMSQAEADGIVFRGTNEGSKLAGSPELWINGDLISNSNFGESGFNGIPSGFRNHFSGGSLSLGAGSIYWSSTENEVNTAWARSLSFFISKVGRDDSEKRTGFSIRCLSDEILISGCTDINATNYNVDATSDDFSCEFERNYNLIYGNNLVGFPGVLENSETQFFLDNTLGSDFDINYMFTQGMGLFYEENEWTGNLLNVSQHEGYWLNIVEDQNVNIIFKDVVQNCESYPTGEGNNLISFRWGENSQPTVDALGGNDYALEHFNFILGQGQGLFNLDNEWTGNLTTLDEGKGYWVNIKDNVDLNFKWGGDNCATPSDEVLSKSGNEIQIPEEFQVYQSTEQAFYIINEVEEIEFGDLITAYCGEELVGSAFWDGEYTVIPVMGKDLSESTNGFCEQNEVPSFVLSKDPLTGIGQDLIGEIQGFSNLGVYAIEKLEYYEDLILPKEWSLSKAYPNPFNPVTTIEIGVPELVESLRVTTLQVFDINGRLINTLINGKLKPGFHTIEWDATNYSSGVYFVKMLAGDPSINSGQGFSQSQKIMLVK